MVLIPLVMINRTIKKYEINKKIIRFMRKPLWEKTIGRGENFTKVAPRAFGSNISPKPNSSHKSTGFVQKIKCPYEVNIVVE